MDPPEEKNDNDDKEESERNGFKLQQEVVLISLAVYVFLQKKQTKLLFRNQSPLSMITDRYCDRLLVCTGSTIPDWKCEEGKYTRCLIG